MSGEMFWLSYIAIGVSASLSTWIIMAVRRPKDVKCINCGHYVPVKQFHTHWKACL